MDACPSPPIQAPSISSLTCLPALALLLLLLLPPPVRQPGQRSQQLPHLRKQVSGRPVLLGRGVRAQPSASLLPHPQRRVQPAQPCEACSLCLVGWWRKLTQQCHARCPPAVGVWGRWCCDRYCYYLDDAAARNPACCAPMSRTSLLPLPPGGCPPVGCFGGGYCQDPPGICACINDPPSPNPAYDRELGTAGGGFASCETSTRCMAAVQNICMSPPLAPYFHERVLWPELAARKCPRPCLSLLQPAGFTAPTR